jgi:hypothetical protein
MSNALVSRIRPVVRSTCVLLVGIVLCIFIFLPLFSAFSAQLSLLVIPIRYGARFIITNLVLDALAFCVSGFLTGVLVGSFSRKREIGTTMFASLVVTAWYVIAFGSIPVRAGLSGTDLAYGILEVAICATCLSVSAFLSAWLIRKRHLRE